MARNVVRYVVEVVVVVLDVLAPTLSSGGAQFWIGGTPGRLIGQGHHISPAHKSNAGALRGINPE